MVELSMLSTLPLIVPFKAFSVETVAAAKNALVNLESLTLSVLFFNESDLDLPPMR